MPRDLFPITALPRFAQIEPMASCNLACRMCTVPQREGGDDITQGALALADFERWLDQLPGLEELQLQGLGEPMLNRHFFEMIERATARGIRVTSNSNLTLLTPSRARRCVTSGLAELSVSLDGATAATYESIRLKGRFDRFVRNLARLTAARAELDSPTPHVRLVLVLMRQNLAEIPALVRLAADHGVDAVLVQRLAHPLDEPTLPARYIPVRSFIDTAQLRAEDEARAATVFAEAEALARTLGVALHLPRLRTAPGADGMPTRAGRCTWPWDGVYLTARGEMLPCCMVGTPDRANFGSVGESGIEAVWNGEAARAFRTALAGAEPPRVCRSCALYHGEF
jgi:MoaA/NifB/PqqE/SkfB family radical SAM enzyme